jgi:hypothetical protein
VIAKKHSLSSVDAISGFCAYVCEVIISFPRPPRHCGKLPFTIIFKACRDAEIGAHLFSAHPDEQRISQDISD